MKILSLATAFTGILACTQLASHAQTNNPKATFLFCIVTAPTSPNNDSSIQNAITAEDRLGSGRGLGDIPTDIATNPAAFDAPGPLRVCQICFGPSNFFFWDAQASNAVGNFASENGQRFAWIGDWRDTNLFLVSDLSFEVRSSDGFDTLLYTGNLATNTDGGAPLTFSPTLVGEVMDANGNITASYHNGETIPDHPVNRVLCALREGYYCTDMSDVDNALTYFHNEIPFTNYVTITSSGGASAGSWISSRPFLDINITNVTLEGQRQLGMTYGLQQTPKFTNISSNRVGAIWTTVADGMVDGSSYTNTLVPNAFYRAFEDGSAGPNLVIQGKPSVVRPKLVVSNGPEK